MKILYLALKFPRYVFIELNSHPIAVVTLYVNLMTASKDFVHIQFIFIYKVIQF